LSGLGLAWAWMGWAGQAQGLKPSPAHHYLDGKDVITIAATGSGKSFPYWMQVWNCHPCDSVKASWQTIC